jgi:periplasmic divalent cation tolerance protein
MLVYMTAPSREEALAIGRALVESRLAACVNVLDSASSIYWWNGEMQEATEAVLIAKTRHNLVTQLVAKAKELHSYELPAISALPVLKGNGDFLNWVESETLQDED